MYANLILFTEPRRPLINPKFDLFAWIETDQIPALFPAKVVDKVQLVLPEKCRRMEKYPQDTWEFIEWQVEEKGYAVVRSVDNNWLYWAILAEKYTLMNMARVL